jgi:heme-degrading monooxygenase HmoA
MVTRMITIHVPQDKANDAERTWKHELGPLVARQNGCLSHLLLRSREVPNKFVSISNWASKHAVDQFVQGDAREEIKNYTRSVLGATDVAVELYEAFG